ncbi:MFS transporter, partial [Streptomyces sp. 2MCAF27]
MTKAAPSRPWAVVLVVVCAQMLIWLDTSILNVAVTTLADPDRGLGATPAELEWVASASTLVFAGTLFAGGALADRFGPRTTLLAGLALFGAASGAGAFAGSPAWLIVARGFMGAGSALLMPATLSIIVRSTPAEKRTRAIAIWSSSSGLGVAVGPVVGGALLSHFWWGSVFLVNVPIVALCLAGVAAFVPELGGARRQVLDLPGLALSVLGLGGLV